VDADVGQRVVGLCIRMSLVVGGRQTAETKEV
jgi:hypothetical protein